MIRDFVDRIDSSRKALVVGEPFGENGVSQLSIDTGDPADDVPTVVKRNVSWRSQVVTLNAGGNVIEHRVGASPLTMSVVPMSPVGVWVEKADSSRVVIHASSATKAMLFIGG